MKKSVVVLAIIGLIGFSAGYNYYSGNTLSEIEGCFVFGFASLAMGKNAKEFSLTLIKDLIKNYLLFSLGAFVKFLIPFSLIGLFAINFRTGVFFSCVMHVLKFKGIVEIIFLAFLSLFVLATSIFACERVLERFSYHMISHRLDSTDGEFLLKSLCFCIAFGLIMFVLLILCRFTKNSIFGFFNSFL